jgi:hypothetical protein
MDILMKLSKSEEVMESFIKNNLIMKKEVNLLNIFESIQKLQKMTIIKTNKLLTVKNAGELMSLSKYKKLIREEMQKMNTFILYSIFIKTYSYSKITKIENGIIQN